MSKPLNAGKVSLHKDAALSKINDLLNGYINDPKPEHLKKANLISYWLENYIAYIQREEIFEPSRLKRYERGDIIKVNFGFNVGSEYGGLHYAIVLDKENARNSPVITVIPLTSYTDGDNIHSNDVFLGNELYLKLQLKIRGLKQNLSTERQQTETLRASIQTLLDILEPLLNEVASTDDVNKITMNDEQESAFNQAIEQLKSIQAHEKNIQKQESLLNKASLEIAKMKNGSVALPNQITTISKQRIYDPKNSYDVLSGVKLSPDGLDKLNNGLKKLFFN